MGSHTIPGVTTHAALTDVSTPHALADLVAAVCSETEADGKITTHAALAIHLLDSIVGDVEEARDIESETTDSLTYEKKMEIKLLRAGAYRIKFNIGSSDPSFLTYGKIYRNGEAVGTERSNGGGGVEFSEDIAGWSAGDLCQVYIHKPDPSDTETFTVYSFHIYTGNLMLSYVIDV